jgi:hypothetical protein
MIAWRVGTLLSLGKAEIVCAPLDFAHHAQDPYKSAQRDSDGWLIYVTRIEYPTSVREVSIMAKNMVPDEIMKALDFAEFIMAKEKKDRIGSSDVCVLPMKFFLLHDQKSITGLMGSPFQDNNFDEKEQMSLAVRLFALALNAKVVLHVTEGWVATKCADCGVEEAGITDDGKCMACGSEVVAPSDNPYAEEMLICTLSIKDNDKAFFWMSRFERDETGKILDFADWKKCEPMDAVGRFSRIWALERWMGPHFAVNYPVVLKALGRPVEDKFVEAARMAKEMASPDYPFIRLNIENLQVVKSKMKSKHDVERN